MPTDRATEQTPSPSPSPLDDVFRVGSWRVERLSLSLTQEDGAGEPQRLEPRVMALLVRLAEERCRPVPREELVESVWGGAFVGDDAVNSAVARLRRALDRGDGGSASAIETIPRVGYRLRLPVRSEPADIATRPGASVAEASAGPSPPGGPAGAATPGPMEPRLSPSSPPTAGSPDATARRGALLSRRSALALAASVVALVTAALAASRGEWTADTPQAGAGDRPTAARVSPLTSLAGLEVNPALAPSDDRVAFAWQGPDGDNWDLYVQSADGGPPLRLTSHPAMDHRPTWTPDASRIAFVRQREGGCGIWIVPALGGEERRLASCTNVSDLAFSEDGRRLVYCDLDGGEGLPAEVDPFSRRAMFELDLATGAVRRLSEPPPGGAGDHAVAVADDGTIAFLRSPVPGVEDLHLLEADGEVRRLTFDDLRIHDFDWLPGRRGLVVSSNRNGLFSLWRIRPDGGEPVWLGTAGGIVDGLSVSADGRRVAFEEWHSEINLYRLEMAAPESRQLLTHSTRWDYQPALSPDGSRLAFVSDRAGSPEIWIADADGGDASPLTSFAGSYVSAPSWSPDGRRIAFDLRASGHGDLWLLELPDARPRRLTRSAAQDLAPTWSPDGRSLYFASNRSGSWEVWRLGLEGGGNPVQVTRGGGYRALPSPGGGLVFNRFDTAGLWRQPLAGGAPEQLLDDLDPADRLNWTLVGATLFYVTRPDPERPHLARLDLATGERELIAPLDRLSFGSGLAVSPAGDGALVALTDRFESDLMLLELTEREGG